MTYSDSKVRSVGLSEGQTLERKIICKSMKSLHDCAYDIWGLCTHVFLIFSTSHYAVPRRRSANLQIPLLAWLDE